MKYLSSIVETVRKGLARWVVVAPDESSSSPIELVDETSPWRADVEDKSVLMELNEPPKRPAGDLFALDSSSRVVETPYIFVALSAASVFSRFTGRGVDIPGIGSLTGVEEPTCRHIVVIPEVERAGFDSTSLENNPAVLTKNPVGIPYNSTYNKYALLNELRLHVENCVLEESIKRGVITRGSVLFLDGPLIYPSIQALDHSITPLERKTYVEAVEHLNKTRVKLLRILVEEGVQVVSIVKRLNRSYILSAVDPVNLSQGKSNDEVYLSALVFSRRELHGKHLVLGPLVLKQKAGYGLSRFIWYIGISRRPYPLRGGLGNYVFYRVEAPEGSHENEVLRYVVYDSVHAGSTVPLSLLIVDRRVKKITSSLVNYVLYNAGLSEEATIRYISMF